MKLVIVESPAKGKTIEGYLGKGYKVLASFGHVRDLPKSKLGIDLETFEPDYVIPTKARKQVNILKKEATTADKVILATDEDREGEAISWHLATALDQPKEKYERITFHEITKSAIEDAIKNPRKLDQNLVDAQQGRRVLDRLVGYNLSPLLWKKIRRGLSAGRVQSVAVKLIVDREREIQAFNPEEYWEFLAHLSKDTKVFDAKLTKKDGKNFEIGNAKEADSVESTLKKGEYIVGSVDQKEYKKTPPAPFITSSLQQESARKLYFSAKKTMSLAQKLYEGVTLPGEGSHGLITYMRTDSTNLAASAVSEARNYIEESYGKNYLSAGTRSYKKSKGAQEAHEAIRPTSFFRDPGKLKDILEPDMLKLYELIWKRALASQMAEEILDLTGVDIKVGEYTLRANGKKVRFDGYSKVYLEGGAEKIAEDSKEVLLPDLKEGDKCKLEELEKLQKFTQPPARYSEASLIRELEKNGIGRPSTYAPTLSTIKDRGYVMLEQRRFVPEEIGFIVNDLLVENFPEIVSIDFTAKMEGQLDDVAEGKEDWKKPVKEFYAPFAKEIAKAEEKIEKINTDVATDEVCEKCGKPMVIKTGRFGKFLACTGFPDCKNTKAIVEKAAGKCPECKEGDIVVRRTKRGRTFYGCSRYPDCDWATWKLPAEKETGQESKSIQ